MTAPWLQRQRRHEGATAFHCRPRPASLPIAAPTTGPTKGYRDQPQGQLGPETARYPPAVAPASVGGFVRFVSPLLVRWAPPLDIPGLKRYRFESLPIVSVSFKEGASVMKVTIFEGTPDEYREFLRQHGPAGRQNVTEPVAPVEPLDPSSNSLSVPAIIEALGRVTEGARESLKVICQHAPMVSYDTVADQRGVTTSVLAGNKSSIGRNAPFLNAVVRSDDNRRVYRVSLDAAAIILEALRSTRAARDRPAFWSSSQNRGLRGGDKFPAPRVAERD